MAGVNVVVAVAVALPGVTAAPWSSWLLFGFLIVTIAGAVAGCSYLAWRTPTRERLAQRADRNGRALLELADEIEEHLLMQQLSGASIQAQRHWPRLCRRLAMEHLECINRLMLENVPRE
ncbi:MULTISPECIES: hypothetical protein [Lysobacter]|uniref:hypothetical protein n=1 Tax=Lysobacter TaxID=68 RepID=UPI001F2F6515|nr:MULTISPECIES: hypothetical protein [Lysobacter]UJB21661.1 hypothetical protein L1A79_11665 [Lysobacter capsici]UJQ29222.1 hypothetical protein L2D09_03200 [Lysobacter gummosus]